MALKEEPPQSVPPLPPPPLPASEPPLPDGPERREQLRRELSSLADSCDRELSSVMDALSWRPRAGGSRCGMSICPYDVNHRMPKSSMEKHVATCKLRKLGHSKEEADVCDPSYFYGKLRASTFTIDKALQFQIIKQAREKAQIEYYGDINPGVYPLLPPEVPLNHKRAICDLTQADRLAIYDYVLEETKKQQSRAQASANDSDLFEDLTTKMSRDGDQKTPKSHLEMLAEMRDYKRRRQSYRAKNVHITKKSYTEVIRDVISVHMEELVHHWQEEGGSEDSETKEGGSSLNPLKSIIRVEGRRSESVDSFRSGSVESVQSTRLHRDDGHSQHRDHSCSPHKRRSRGKGKESRKRKERVEERRSESVDSIRSGSVESVQASGLHGDDGHSQHTELSCSPHKRRSRGKGKQSRKRKGRDEDRHRSHKKRK